MSKKKRAKHLTLTLFSSLTATMAGASEVNVPNTTVTEAKKKASETAEEVSFDSIFFDPTVSVNLDRYAKGNPVSPGTYRLDVIVNQSNIGQYDIRFTLPTDADNSNIAVPCLDDNLLNTIGVEIETKNSSSQTDEEENNSNSSCKIITSLPQGSTYNYISEEQKIEISIPQIFLQNRPRGWVDPSQWESGINAVMFDYNINTFSSKTSEHQNTNAYGSAEAGVNLFSWRFRHIGSLNWNSNASQDKSYNYQSSSTYLEHDITFLKSQLRIGNTYTQGGLFSGFHFNGLSLYSDDRMLPDSQNGYAPTIRGTAISNAKVTVLQNEQIIHQITVAPGPFEINDLYPSSYSGDLVVRIEESTGTIRTFTVPYSSTPQLLRPDMQRFSATVGKYSDRTLLQNPIVSEFTYQRGLTNNLTSYLGVQYLENYQATLIGSAFNTRIGSFSLEMTHARSQFSDETKNVGNSYRAAFNRSFELTDTNFTLAAYRYSTFGYLDLKDAIAMENFIQQGQPVSDIKVQRSRLEATINQTLPADLGNFYLTGSSQQFWNAGKRNSYIIGYNTTWRGMTLSASYQNARVHNISNIDNINSESYMQFSVSIPFGSSPRNQTLNFTHAQSGSGRQNNQIGYSGSLGETSNTSYFINTSRSSNSGNDVNFGGGYLSNYGRITSSAGVSNRYKQLSIGMSGGIVAYKGGVKFGPSLGSTIAIVEAPGTEGAHIGQNAQVGKDGVALVTNLMPYRLNSIGLDPAHIPINVQLDNTTAVFAPRAGSVHLIKFNTSAGNSLLLEINGDEIPFGAEVFDEANNPVGVVGQGGRAFLLLKQPVNTNKQKTKRLFLKWGDKVEQRCELAYQITQKVNQTESDMDFAQANCINLKNK